MCGIVAIYGANASHWAAYLDTMLDRLSHRGPDDQGTYVDSNIALGQTRLSIVDVAGGRQPIFAEDGQNGIEISSKEELYYFRIFRNFFGTDVDVKAIGRWRGGFSTEGSEL